jgi:hypothetical protein
MAWLDDLKMLLGIPPADTSQDAMITFLSGIALQAIQARTGRLFLPGIYLDTFPGPHQTIYTTEYPITELLEIVENGGALPAANYSVDMERGRITFSQENGYCATGYGYACSPSMKVTYKANETTPPDWVTFVVSDAVRSSLAMSGAGNEFGFVASKISVTDVGSVDFGKVGESPMQSLQQIIDGTLEGWIAPTMSYTVSCCNGRQTSQLIAQEP